MLNIKLIRNNPQIVRKDLEKRKDNNKLTLLNQTIQYDQEWLKAKKEIDILRNKRNTISKDISEAKKQGKDTSEILKQAALIPKQIQEKEERITFLENNIKNNLYNLPNILHESVPYGATDEDNLTVKTFGKKPDYKFPLKSHRPPPRPQSCRS